MAEIKNYDAVLSQLASEMPGGASELYEVVLDFLSRKTDVFRNDGVEESKKKLNGAIEWRQTADKRRNHLEIFVGLMTLEMYRQTTLGKALTDVLTEYIDNAMITPQMEEFILLAFDWHMNKALANKKKNKCPIFFEAKKLVTYNYYDDVWSFIIANVQFKDVNKEHMTFAKKVKVVAMDRNLSTFKE